MLRPLCSHRIRQLDDGGFGCVVGALLLWMQHPSAGDGRDEDDGTALLGFYHVPTAGLGYQERTREVDVDEATKHLGIIVLGFDIGAISHPAGEPHAFQ